MCIPLIEEMATHSIILAQSPSWTEEPGGLQSRGCKEFGTTECLQFHWSGFHFISLCLPVYYTCGAEKSKDPTLDLFL